MNSALSLLTAQQNLYGLENEFRAEFIQHLMLGLLTLSLNLGLLYTTNCFYSLIGVT
jgi:hypothetical protein